MISVVIPARLGRLRIALLGGAAICLLFTAPAQAGSVLGFTDNPTGNFAAWSAFMAPLGGASNLDFDDHPVGPFNPNFYSAAHGVTFQALGAVGGVQFGAGPGQSDATAPLSEGEGPHAPSNYLLFSPGSAAMVATFDSPLAGAGMFLIDYFNPMGDNPVTIRAFSGPNGTGALLGSFVSVAYNFQPNNMYFMGIGSSGGDIGSFSIEATGGRNDFVGGMDFHIPEPHTGLALLVGGATLARSLSRRRCND